MAGPTEGPVRRPAVAGMFYPDDAQRCRDLAHKFIATARARTIDSQPSAGRWIGGIVPHAGWICSGEVAGETIAQLRRAAANAAQSVDVVVIFGAVHMPMPLESAALDSFASWQLPGESSHVAETLRHRVLEASGGLFRVDDRFHAREHAVEVELPLVQQAFEQVSILPVQVPLIEEALMIGRETARRVIDANLQAVFLASSDLTHYGPAYRFAPAGIGTAGLNWARNNDRRLLDLVENFRAEQVVNEVMEHQNACGGGAIAAMLAACRELGATQAQVLRHANSYETLADVAPQQPDNAVGYAAVIVG